MKVFAETPEMRAAMFKALAASQKEFGEIRRTKTVDTTRYKFDYAPLEEVLKACLPALDAHGIFLTQHITTRDDGKDFLVTCLAHEEGGYMESSTLIPSSETMQDLGSDLTYLKRYAISAVLGVSPEDDDDGTRGRANDVRPKNGKSLGQRGVEHMAERGRKEQESVKNGAAVDWREEKTAPDVRSTNPHQPSKEQLEELKRLMIDHGYDTQDKRIDKYKKVLGKMPTAFNKEDIMNMVTVLTAEQALNRETSGHQA